MCNDNDSENKKSPLEMLGDAIDNGEFPGIVSKYKCEKCGRCAEWETYIGIPMQKMPCGGSCDGHLVLQSE
jgi:hypothetical protein